MRFTRSDMKKSILLDPGWTKLKFVSYEEKATKDGKSFNNIFKFINVDEENERFDGVPVEPLIHDSRTTLLIKLARAFGADLDDEKGGEFDFDHVEEGTMVQGNIVTTEWNNNVRNDVSDFAHIDEDVE